MRRLAAGVLLATTMATVPQGALAAVPPPVEPAQVFGPAALPVPLPVPLPPPASEATVTIPAATEIWLTPLREISSKHVRAGDPITLSVARNVYVHRILVIPRGTEATGKISYRTGKGAMGKSAKIEFDLTSLTLNHRALPISGHYRVAGDGNSGWAVATFLLVSMVGSLFITGHSAVVPAGSEWRAITATPLRIALDDDALPATASLREASYRPAPRPIPRTVGASERDLPANSAYVPPPAEILIRSLPPR